MIAQYQYANMPSDMPVFMISALRYELAFRLAAERGVTFNAAKMQTKAETFTYLLSKREIDIRAPARTEMTSRNQSGTPPFPIWMVMSGSSAS